jgi:hypothetical protein
VADETSTGFFFDVRAWRGSRTVQRMTMAERGVYLEMLCEQWEKRNLPDDAQQVADAIASSDAQVADVLAAWTAVRRKFVTSRGDETRIYNEPLERTRRKQREYRRKRAEAGAVGGRNAAAKRKAARELEASNATAVLSDAIANPSDLNRQDKTRPDQKRRDKTREVDGLFDRFWAAYPKKKSKDEARRAWDKRRPDEALLAVMLQAIETQRQSADWLKKDGQFIPHPATWLNGARWTDAVEVEVDTDGLSETARHNLAALEGMQRILLEDEARRNGREH